MLNSSRVTRLKVSCLGLALAILGLGIWNLSLGSGTCPAAEPDWADSSRYHTYARMVREVESLVSLHPNIARIETIGLSHVDSLPILGVKVSDNPGSCDPEPSILLAGCHHGCELIGAEICLYALDWLLANHESTYVRRFVDSLQIFIVPMLNPDGRMVNFVTPDTWWRKNKRDNNGNGFFDPGDGVDLNRNYPFRWSSGGSTNPLDREYRGPYALSESETQALASLTGREQFVIAVDYHSSKDSPDWERIYYQWVWGGELCPDYYFKRPIAESLARRIPRDGGGFYQAVITAPTGGQYRCWSYNDFRAFTYLIEVSRGYQPPVNWVDTLCRRNLNGARYLLERMLGPGVWGEVRDSISLLPLKAQVVLLETDTGLTYPPQLKHSDSLLGRFYRLVNPGSYHFQASCSGYVTKTVGVNAAGSGPTGLEILLGRATDVGIASIELPETIDSLELVSPACTVHNYGAQAETYLARLRIGSIYRDSALVSNHLPGTSRRVAFPACSVWQRGTHVVTCSVRLAGDLFPENDTASGLLTVHVHDAAVRSIAAPTGLVPADTAIVPACTVANYGSVAESYSVRMRIGPAYDESATATSHQPGAQLELQFPVWHPSQTGFFAVTCSTQLNADMNPANDLAVESVQVYLTLPEGWREVASMPFVPSCHPSAVKGGAWLAFSPENGLIFAAKGTKTGDFYAYDPDQDSWAALAPIPEGAESKSPDKGCRACFGDGMVYMTKGNNTQGFWQYDVELDSWQQIADVPLGNSGKRVKNGADLVFVPSPQWLKGPRDQGNKCARTLGPLNPRTLSSGYVYLLKGRKSDFMRFNTGTGSWQPLPDAPAGTRPKWNEGSWLVYDQASTIYAHKANRHELWAFDVDSLKWRTEPLTPMPFQGLGGRTKKSKDGGCATWHDCIYALKGGNTQEFWRYSPLTDSWQELDTMPALGSTGKKKKVKTGGDIVSCGSGTAALSFRGVERRGIPSAGVEIPPPRLARGRNDGPDGAFFALKGSRTRELWRYVLPQTACSLQLTACGPEAMSRVGRNAYCTMHAYPSPLVSGFAHLDFNLPKSGPARLTVIDVSGRTVLERSLLLPSGGRLLLDTRPLSTGTYFLRLETRDLTATVKLVLQR